MEREIIIQAKGYAKKRLNQLAEAQSTTEGEIMKHALELYSFVIDEVANKSGKQLAITSCGNHRVVAQIIHVPGLSRPVLKR